MDVQCPCGTTFTARSRTAKFCSDRCRKQSQRRGSVVTLPAKLKDEASAVGVHGGVEEATLRALQDADRLETPLGQTCLVLARRLDRPMADTGSAMASVAARLEDLLGKATRGVGKATSPQSLQDELAERRAKHGA